MEVESEKRKEEKGWFGPDALGAPEIFLRVGHCSNFRALKFDFCCFTPTIRRSGEKKTLEAMDKNIKTTKTKTTTKNKG